MIDIIALIISIAVAFIAYILFFISFIKGFNAKEGRKFFYKATKKIIVREIDNNQKYEELLIVYNRLTSSNKEFSEEYKSVLSILEDLVSRSSGLSDFMFKLNYWILFEENEIERINQIIFEIKENKPFTNLKSHYGYQLDIVKKAIENNDRELGLYTLRTLASEVEKFDDIKYSLQKQSQRSYMFSILGFIFTILFGTVSVMQFFDFI